MLILGIETSCDETSAAVVENGVRVLSCTIASSAKDFERVGGVIPEEAARRQLETILPVIEKALAEAKVSIDDIDAIAVTYAPGLLGSLLVGTTTARVLASVLKKPLIPVHHTLGHLSSTWLDAKSEPQFPMLCLSVSGGHSDLWHRTSHLKGLLVSTTRDDAAGEAFDKGAVMLGLPYPGGPALAKLAEGGDEKAFEFPRPLHKEKTTDFSFSGLKTSLKYLLRDEGELTEKKRKDIAASYQFAICRHLIDRLEAALEHLDVKEVHIVGGVAANTRLRAMAEELGKKYDVTVRFPATIRYCTDNGAMIAAAGYFLHEKANQQFETKASLPLETILRT